LLLTDFNRNHQIQTHSTVTYQRSGMHAVPRLSGSGTASVLTCRPGRSTQTHPALLGLSFPPCTESAYTEIELRKQSVNCKLYGRWVTYTPL